MRLNRSSRIALITAIAVALVGVVPGPARAEDPPRHIGSTSIQAIEEGASAALGSHPGCPFLTQRRLTATALSIVFKEASSGLSKAPSPMTLSRFDTVALRPENEGLYAFKDKDTPYQQAFWHPGVGQWQLDEAGVGAPFTADERISTAFSTAYIMDFLADRWCAPAPATEAQGRRQAWGDWGCRTSFDSAQCVALRNLYSELYTNGGMDRLIVDTIANRGGAVVRTCRFEDGTEIPCTYVNPAAAQGDTWWTGNLSGATPIAKPFYVTELDGKERRHWLREDTGYQIDITAVRTIGQNSRPIGASPGLTWSPSSSLCDVTTQRGRCINTGLTAQELVAPAPVNLARRLALEERTPVVGDYTGDGLDDVLWYGSGSQLDQLWLATGNGAFTKKSVTVSGVYTAVTARLGPDGRDDILWYEKGNGRVVRWDSLGDGTFAATEHQVAPGTQPLVGDFDADGRDEVHWYGKGDIPDTYWNLADNTVNTATRTVTGSYLPRVGDFDGNGADDVIWYGPGVKPDSMWLYKPGGSRAQVSVQVSGTYKPTVADLDGDGRSDIYWYAAGPATDTIWFGRTGTSWYKRQEPISGTYELVAADPDADGRDELVLYAPGAGADHYWQFGSDGTLVSKPSVRIDGDYVPRAGSFGTPGAGGLLWARTTRGDAAVWYP